MGSVASAAQVRCLHSDNELGVVHTDDNCMSICAMELGKATCAGRAVASCLEGWCFSWISYADKMTTAASETTVIENKEVESTGGNVKYVVFSGKKEDWEPWKTTTIAMIGRAKGWSALLTKEIL
jgi:hypothetical protein